MSPSDFARRPRHRRSCDLHVESPVHRHLLARCAFERGPGQVRQARRQSQRRPAVGETEQAREPLALGKREVARSRQRCRGICVERVLAHLRELAEVADLGHAARELARGFGRTHHLLVVDEAFLRGDRPDPRLAHGAGGLNDVRGGDELRLREAPLADVEGERHHHQRGDVDQHRALDLDDVRVPLVRIGEHRVAQAAGLNQVRFGEPQLGEPDLQRGLVEERDLDCAFRRQHLGKPHLHGRALRARHHPAARGRAPGVRCARPPAVRRRRARHRARTSCIRRARRSPSSPTCIGQASSLLRRTIAARLVLRRRRIAAQVASMAPQPADLLVGALPRDQRRLAPRAVVGERGHVGRRRARGARCARARRWRRPPGPAARAWRRQAHRQRFEP